MTSLTPKFTRPHTDKWRNIFKSKHFTSSFCFLSFGISVIFFFIGVLLLLQNWHDIKDKMEAEASRAAISVQDILNSVKSNTILVGSLPSVSSVLNHPQPTIDQLSVMLKDLSSFNTMYNYQSMRIFFGASQRIYDSENGFYSFSDYIYQDFLTAVYEEQSYERWILPSPEETQGQASVLLTYAHRLPYSKPQGKGFITFSLSIPYLKSNAASSICNIPYPATVCFQGQLLWGSQDNIEKQWDYAKTPDANARILFPHARAFSYTTEGGIQAAFYISTSQLCRLHLSALGPLFSAWLVSMLFTLAFSFLFALFMLRPMDAMMRKIGLPAYMEIPNAALDEYSLLNDALDNMAIQIKNIDSLMLENKQLIHERLLHDLLYGYVGLSRLSSQYAKNGIVFSLPYFCLALMILPKPEEVPGFAQLEQTHLLARNNAASAFSNLGICYSLYLGNGQMAFIINTGQWEHLRPELLKICVVIKTSLQETLSLCPLFSISLCSPDAPNLHQALVQAQRILLFSSGETSDFVYFSRQQDYVPVIDPDFLLRITQCIMDKDPALLTDLSNHFEKQYLPRGTSPEEARRLGAMLLCSVFVNLLELNIEIKENILTNALSKLESVPTAEACMPVILSGLSCLTGDTAKISGDAHSYIHKAMRYLETHYSESLSIPLIASHTGVSAIYLNRIFKLSTGKTLSEYLNDYRISQSLPMLEDTSETISSISQAVGYSDVRSYIRFFKKFYGMTPSEYRKKHR